MSSWLPIKKVKYYGKVFFEPLRKKINISIPDRYKKNLPPRVRDVQKELLTIINLCDGRLWGKEMLSESSKRIINLIIKNKEKD